MSLKDRLNTAQKPTPVQAAIEQQKEQPKYYATEKEAQVDNLGILDTLLADDEINNIFVSGAKNIFINKKGKARKSTSTFRDNVQLINILKKIAQNQGVTLDEKSSFLKFNYALGINATATLPPLSNVATLFIKCYKDKHATLQILQEELSISKEIALILEALCSINKNILIIGETNTLKTTLLSALAKKVPNNNRAVIIDNENEVIINNQNYTNYNFSLVDNIMQKNIIDFAVDSLADKIIVNSNCEKLYSDIIQKCVNHKGFIATLNAHNPQDALDKSIEILQKNISNLTLQKARGLFLNAFDVIITTAKDELGRRKISLVSEINLLSENNIIQDIFVCDYSNQHKSTGAIPLFYEDIKTNSLPIGDNIFDISYKHTYHKNIDIEAMAQLGKKSANIDILKKFKKNLPTQEENEFEKVEETQENEVQNVELNEQELAKKVQEKFEEMKNSIQSDDEFKINLEEIESTNNELNDENI